MERFKVLLEMSLVKILVLNAFLFFTVGYIVYAIQGNEKWFTRFVLALASLAAYKIIDQLEEIKSHLSKKDLLNEE